MKLKTIAKLFGAVVEDDYGSPQRDATLPGWFRWYLDHMPVRENVYGTLIDIGLTGTQANVIIERIWPQIASIQQEAIDLAKAGNESGAIAKLNEAASLAERLAREAAEHERLLGRGIEPEPSRLVEERDMATQAEKVDWPRQVVERDNYILINDYLGAGYAQANPELVETLVRIAADYLAARPDVAFDNLWAYTYDALKKMYSARERGIEIRGGRMKAAEMTFGMVDRFEEPLGLAPFSEQIMKKIPLSYRDAVRELERYIDTLNLSPADRDKFFSDVSDFWLWAEPRKTMYPDYTGALVKAKAWADQHYGPEKVGGGMMEASTIVKMFGAKERLQAVVPNGEMRKKLRTAAEDIKPGRTYEQHFERVAPDVGEETGSRNFITIAKTRGYLEQVRQEILARKPDWPHPYETWHRTLENALVAWSGIAESMTLSGGASDETVLEHLRKYVRAAIREASVGVEMETLYRTDPLYQRTKSIERIDYGERIEWLISSNAMEGLWLLTDSDHAEEICNALSTTFASDYERLVRELGKEIVTEQELNEILMGPLRDLAWDFALEQLRKDRESGRKIVVEERGEEIARQKWLTGILARELEDLPSFYAEYVVNQIYWSLSWRYPNWDMDEAAIHKVAGPLIDAAKEAEQNHKTRTGGGIMPKLLSLRSILMAAASLGDLLSLLRKVKEPDKEVTAAIKKLEGMVAKYDEGAKLEDVNTASMKRILTNLKKVKPTKDQPRTRVLKAVKLLEDLLKTKVSSAVLQASIVQVARILKAVEEPTEEVKDAIKLADQLAKSYEEGGPKKYGKVVSVEGLTKLLKMLEAIEEKPDPVVKAVAALKKLLGAEEEKPVAPGERGKLPSYGLAKLESALKPGVYRARLIRAGEALDGTTWPEEQLKIAFEKGYFEGVPVNAISYTGQYGPDIEYHLPLDTEIAGKVVGNQVGFIKDTKWDDEEHAGYGFVYITEKERRNLIDAMLEQGIDAPGMSIYADGMKDENDIVTGINGVTSMDLVTFPAADGAILSQALTASVKEWGEMRKRLRTAAEAGPARFTPGEGGGAPRERADEDQRMILGYAQDRLGEEGVEFTDKQMEEIVAYILPIVRPQLKRRTLSKDSLIIEPVLWDAVERILKKPRPTWVKKQKTGGGIMSPTALEQRLDVVEKISQGLNERVAQADTDGMIELKLQASKLPEKVQKALRGQLLGKQLTEDEIDSFIKFQQGITDDLATELAATAHVTLGGGVLPGEGKDTLEGALTALFEKQA